MFRLRMFLSFWCFLFVAVVNAEYEFPEVYIEALTPRGLIVSIPDEYGVRLFSFHGKVNKEIKIQEEGLFSKDVTEAVDGRWTIFIKAAKLNVGDIIHYWIKVEHFDGELRQEYHKDNQSFRINELVYDENIYGPSSTPMIRTTEAVPVNTLRTASRIRMSESEPTTTSSWIRYTTNQTTTNRNTNQNRTIPIPWIPDETQTEPTSLIWTPPATAQTISKTRSPATATPTRTTFKPTTATTPATTTTRTTTKSTTTTTENPNCKYTPTLVNGKRTCQGQLIFEEHFKELSDSNWQTEVKFAGDPDYEFVIYQDNSENLYVKDEMLHIKPTLVEDRYGHGFVLNPDGLDLGDNCTAIEESFDCVQKPKAWITLPPVLSAQITTKDRFCFAYGVIEIRARLPMGDWIYPELFLLSRNEDYGVGYDSGLLKIAYAPGNADLSKILNGGCIFGSSVVARNYGLKSIRSTEPWTEDFHVFRMEWKTDSITLIVDDQVYGNIYPPDGGFVQDEQELEVDAATAQRWRKGSVLAPFDKEMYLALGVGVGGHCFANKKDGKKPWVNDDPKEQLNFYRAQDVWHKTWNKNSSLVVDYVKVWAL